ncbi:MAG: 3-mercaptopyruvate sulfurtransferase [Pseudomonadota bacterium]|nr:3-mercaptopyruvate sulfurtransferase [Pseudomonadota bacterium]
MIKYDEILTSTDWLEQNLDMPNIRILDASWHLPDARRNPKLEFQSSHIPKAQFFDIDLFSDPESSLPHMIPSVEFFSEHIKSFGLGDEHHIVVYDSLGMFSAARVWWLFKFFGCCNISILNGGLPKWLAESKPLSGEISEFAPRDVSLKVNAKTLCGLSEVKMASKSRSSQIIDARPRKRFEGRAAEPRPGLRSGRIPGSKNICYRDILNSDLTVKDVDTLKSLFAEQGISLTKPIITTCGSGITAAILYLALELIGARSVSLYDGSWAEWGSLLDLPVERD